MERNQIGTIFLPAEDIALHYTVLGNSKEGYGLEILLVQDGNCTKECCTNITKDYSEILRFGKAVCKGAVFPGFLSELVEEWVC